MAAASISNPLHFDFYSATSFHPRYLKSWACDHGCRKCYEEQYFDVYCYTNAVDLLTREFIDKKVTIVRGPNYDNFWSEVTIRDINGYQITFGGGIVNKELVLG
jgi:hypothetical protein